MDAGLLDVLHDPADVHVGAVAQRVDVDLDGVVEEAVDEHGAVVGDLGGVGDVGLERLLVVDDLHAATTEHVGRAHQHRVSDAGGDLARTLEGGGRAVLRGRQVGLLEHAPELTAIFREVDGLGRGTDDRHPGGFRRRARPSGVWPPSWTMTPATVPDSHSAR